ncbi:MAG: D-aminoacylase [Planctomycetes bacterium]|nr:D-aminoacylase [Planctomycetota bacterium]
MPDLTGSFDLLLRRGRIVDGSGSPWYPGDVGVRGDRIAAVGHIPSAQAKREIDASGKVVCPGFIDVHVHSEMGILTGEASEGRIRQGVTTDLLAPDGLSFAPLSVTRLAEMRRYLAIFLGEPELDWSWSSLAEYLARFEGRVAMNVVPQVAFNAIRAEAVGWEARPATPTELERMKDLTREAMEQGACGIQTGLEYYPSAHSGTDELVEVSRVVAEHGGVYSSHIRGYGDRLGTALEETFAISERAGLPVHVSHLFGLPELYRPLEAARARGIDVTYDAYPYTAGCTHLIYCFPPWAQSGTPGEIVARLGTRTARERIRPELEGFFQRTRRPFENIIFSTVTTEPNRHLEGKSLDQALKDSGKDLTDFACDLLVEERLGVLMIFHWSGEDVLRSTLTHPLHMVGSDGIFRPGKVHPRGYGAYPRILGRMVREKHWLTLEDAVRRMSSFPAQRYGLRDRGLVRAGLAADLVVFDPERVIDQATFEDGRKPPEGIAHVLVNGQLVLDGGRMTSARPGRVLRTRT